MNIKKLLTEAIDYTLDGVDFEQMIIESQSAENGDYCLPCFSLAKTLHKSPIAISETIQGYVKKSNIIEHTECKSGYLNFFLNRETVSKLVLDEYKDASSYKTSEGKGKVICIDYASPNLAKYLHIGHLKNTIVGESTARLFEERGYTVKRLNYVGDYGTPFGKIIGGLLKWGSVEDVKARGNDALQEYYVRFNAEEVNDPALSQYARDIFKKIEEKDAEIYPLYQFIIEIARADSERMFEILGVKFDDWRGEGYYKNFVPEIVKMLMDKNLLVESQGAKIVDLTPYDLTPSVLIKNDGTSLYTTRDICAVIERDKEYHFDKILYVTGKEQILNFKQLFKIVELMGYDFYKDMEHLAYGMFSLPEGKISSRRGKQAYLVDFIEYIMKKANEAIANRKFTIERPEDVARKVARAVLNYSTLKVEIGKDCVFNFERAFSFEGETAPYMQYTYTRIASVLRKYESNKATPDFSCIDVDGFELVKMINNFTDTISIALEKRDASIVAKRVMDVCKAFNKFYTNNKILDGNNATTNAKIALMKSLKVLLTVGFNLICIDTLEEM